MNYLQLPPGTLLAEIQMTHSAVGMAVQGWITGARDGNPPLGPAFSSFFLVIAKQFEFFFFFA
jgi:hypothetical protein